LWCVQVPLPGIPTIIAAAKPISNSLTAERLVEYSFELLEGFLANGLQIVACAADGSTVERSIQNLLTAKAKKRRVTHFKHPGNGSTITMEIPLFGENSDKPVVMIQDSQHGCKTARNTAFSGARMLVLGNYTVLFEDLRRLATEGGPLFNRDVEKLDRQDDSAATRLFSGDALQWLVEKYPDLHGTIIYLFIFGELIDAYQNRQISLHERIKMAFRARFFIETWEKFIDSAHYPKAKHFLSKETCDIMKTLIDGLIKLVLVYRDLPIIYPLLLWLLSTEVCEHVFGLSRQILPDFTVLDFIYMIPKLFVRLREAIFLQTTSDGKERASGYNHTYHDNRDINLNALSIFPSDSEIQDAIESAYEESENLWHFLGFNIDWDLADVDTVRLPTIESWFTPGQKSSTLCDPIDSDYESDLEPEEVRVSETRQIHDAITHLETAKQKLSLDEEDKVSNLTFAAVSLAVNDSMEMYVTKYSLRNLLNSLMDNRHNLTEYDADTKTKTLEMEASMVEDAIRRCLPSLILPEEPLAPLDRPVMQSLNFNTLVKLRFSHQRKQAETGVRKWCTLTAASSSQCQETAKSEVSLTRREILNQMNAVIKGLEEKGVSTTVGRTLRWQPGRNPKPADAATAGNSVNAQEMARKQSSAVSSFFVYLLITSTQHAFI
jgi:hypothetical protein